MYLPKFYHLAHRLQKNSSLQDPLPDLEVDSQDQCMDDDEDDMVMELEDEDESDDEPDMNETPAQDSQMVENDIPATPAPEFGDVSVPPGSPLKTLETFEPGTPCTPSILEDAIPLSQPDNFPESPAACTPKVEPVDKTAIVMVSDSEETPKKNMIKDDDENAKRIALYQEKIQQLKSQLTNATKKKTAEKLSWAIIKFPVCSNIFLSQKGCLLTC